MGVRGGEEGTGGGGRGWGMGVPKDAAPLNGDAATAILALTGEPL